MRCSLARADDLGRVHPMRELPILAIHRLRNFAKPLRPSGVRADAPSRAPLLLRLITTLGGRIAWNVPELDRRPHVATIGPQRQSDR